MKRQTSRPNLILLLTATVITWASCHSPAPVPPEEHHPICYAGKHVIPDTTAAQYQMRFIKAYDTLKMIAPGFLAHHFRIPNAETFSREAICALIFQYGVDSVRIFYGEDSTGGFRLMLKGVDRNGKIVKIKFPKP